MLRWYLYPAVYGNRYNTGRLVDNPTSYGTVLLAASHPFPIDSCHLPKRGTHFIPVFFWWIRLVVIALIPLIYHGAEVNSWSVTIVSDFEKEVGLEKKLKISNIEDSFCVILSIFGSKRIKSKQWNNQALSLLEFFYHCHEKSDFRVCLELMGRGMRTFYFDNIGYETRHSK
jgi:hypothetical protein